MCVVILINIGSSNGFLPESTEPLPGTMLTQCQWRWSYVLQIWTVEMQLVLIVKSVIENWDHKYVRMRNNLISTCTRSACVVTNPVAFTVQNCVGITVYSIVTINHSTTTAVCLTHWGRVTHRCAGNLIIIVVWSIPSHYLNQCWNIVNLAFRNQLQWNVI